MVHAFGQKDRFWPDQSIVIEVAVVILQSESFQHGVHADKQKCDPVHRDPGASGEFTKTEKDQINDAEDKYDQPSEGISLSEFEPEVLL
jgi:hypothetical protein